MRVDDAARTVITGPPEPAPEVDLSDLEPATALVDRGHLERVLTNLLTNAAKYDDRPAKKSALRKSFGYCH